MRIDPDGRAQLEPLGLPFRPQCLTVENYCELVNLLCLGGEPTAEDETGDGPRDLEEEFAGSRRLPRSPGSRAGCGLDGDPPPTPSQVHGLQDAIIGQVEDRARSITLVAGAEFAGGDAHVVVVELIPCEREIGRASCRERVF